MPNMTPIEPRGINAAGKVAVFWVPAIANISAPKLSEIQAGHNISKIIYAFDPQAQSDSSESAHYGSEAVTSVLGPAKFSPFSLTWDDDPQGAISGDEYAHLAYLVSHAQGFIVHRRGLKPDVAPAAGQKVSVYPVQLGTVLDVPVDVRQTAEKLRKQVQASVVSDPALDVAIVG